MNTKLRRMKIKTLTLEGSRFRLKIVPAHASCIACGKKGYARLVDGNSLCLAHFNECKVVAEDTLAKIQQIEKSNQEN